MVRIGLAEGGIRVHIQPSKTLLLELNPTCLAHPEVVDLISENGVERLKIAFMSMEKKQHATDFVLSKLSHFKHLISLDVDRSDATDRGLSYLKGHNTIRSVSAFATDIKGACFKSLSTLPNLELLDCDYCILDSRNLADIAKFPKLRELQLRCTNLNDESISLMTDSKHIEVLDISNNKLTDACIPSLIKMTSLRYLNLGSTKITDSAVMKLAVLHLNCLILPRTPYSPEELQRIKHSFPKTTIVVNSPPKASREWKHLAAPLRSI